ncbi:MAG TPA: hypothetical protein PL004_11105 [Bacillota bacterium]|nr:hypothetical protein [Bacillota bacterium]
MSNSFRVAADLIRITGSSSSRLLNSGNHSKPGDDEMQSINNSLWLVFNRGSNRMSGGTLSAGFIRGKSEKNT